MALLKDGFGDGPNPDQDRPGKVSGALSGPRRRQGSADTIAVPHGPRRWTRAPLIGGAHRWDRTRLTPPHTLPSITRMAAATVSLAAALSLFDSTPAGAAPTPRNEDWGQFGARSTATGSTQVVDTVTIRCVEITGASGVTRVWVAERTTTTHSPEGPPVSRWADSQTCTALVPAINRLARTEPQTIQPPELWRPAVQGRGPAGQTDDGDDLSDDRVTLLIDAPGTWAGDTMTGRITLTGGAGTPVAVGISAAMVALEPCWTADAPSLR